MLEVSIADWVLVQKVSVMTTASRNRSSSWVCLAVLTSLGACQQQNDGSSQENSAISCLVLWDGELSAPVEWGMTIDACMSPALCAEVRVDAFGQLEVDEPVIRPTEDDVPLAYSFFASVEPTRGDTGAGTLHAGFSYDPEHAVLIRDDDRAELTITSPGGEVVVHAISQVPYRVAPLTSEGLQQSEGTECKLLRVNLEGSPQDGPWAPCGDFVADPTCTDLGGD
jgi:hypothetical protein